MTITREVEAEIRRLALVEEWPRGTIASSLGVHRDVVSRVLDAASGERRERPARPSKLDRYKAFVDQQLAEHPRLRATTLCTMVRKRGFEGSVKTVRRYVALARPKPEGRAYLECERLPGEQAQVDWGKVGTLEVAGGRRVLWVFLMVLPYSRYRYAELVLELGVESLRRSLSRAVRFFGGTPRQWLFDNTKAVVVERFGRAKRLQSDLFDFAAAFRVLPALCKPHTPTDKGTVERGIRDLKERLFAGLTVRSIEQGNRELLAYIDEVVCERKHPRQVTRSVREVWEEERGRLLPLPEALPTTDLVKPVSVDKFAQVRLATNRYSVPPAYAGRTLTLVADDEVVRLLDGKREVARHARSWGREQRVEDRAHRQLLVESRPGAKEAPARERLVNEIPELRVLFERAVLRNRNMGAMVSRTRILRELYGAEVLREAARAQVEHGTHDPGALALLCEQARKKRRLPVTLPIRLREGLTDGEPQAIDLASYDRPAPRRES